MPTPCVLKNKRRSTNYLQHTREFFYDENEMTLHKKDVFTFVRLWTINCVAVRKQQNIKFRFPNGAISSWCKSKSDVYKEIGAVLMMPKSTFFSFLDQNLCVLSFTSQATRQQQSKIICRALQNARWHKRGHTSIMSIYRSIFISKSSNVSTFRCYLSSEEIFDLDTFLYNDK